QWSQVSLPSISFGQEVSATPIQMAVGFSMFANGGYLVKPRLVKALMQEGKIIKILGPAKPVRALSAATVAVINEMMHGVVDGGTGAKAAVEGFDVAGKTGTAQVFNNKTGAYSEDRYLSSFIGFFPLQSPVLTILVMIDSPEGVAWGGAVAGPVFSEIASRSARILRIPGAGAEVYELDWAQVSSAASVADYRRPWSGKRTDDES
ncbi:MAG: penicillin-binding transpeptidase domain-containing protein, partial [Nitrospinota bacterium]|nr:penicillin-binding transpeptidase domain-containing protein [Nitrospinota bacterium]